MQTKRTNNLTEEFQLEEQKARAITEANGSALLKYESGKFAYLLLPSNEKIIISIGTKTVKILTRRPVIGWISPKTVAFQKIEYWANDSLRPYRSYANLNRMERYACGCMALYGLVDLMSRCKSISEIQLAWPDLYNPLLQGNSCFL